VFRRQKLRGALIALSALLALGAGTGALARASATTQAGAPQAESGASGAAAQLRHAGRACTHAAVGAAALPGVRRAAHAAERSCRCALLEHRAQLGRRVGPRALARCSSAGAPQTQSRRAAKTRRPATSPHRRAGAGRLLSAGRRELRAKRRELRRLARANRRRLRAERRAARSRGRQRHRGVNEGRHNSAAADGSSCEGATLEPSEANLALVTQATLCLINRERAHAGEAPLQADADLNQAAAGHSLSMLQHGYFEHVDPDGRGPLERVRASGYMPHSSSGYEIGENIAWGSGSLATPASIVAAWMASPGHRANILRASYRDSGIGIVAQLPGAFGAGTGGAIYTQDFGAIFGG
jgi:uncharacterized protein YkwD